MVVTNPLGGILIQTLRTKAGLLITDATQDDELEAVFEATINTIESYLDRGLRHTTDIIEKFTHKSGYTILLKYYPIDTVTSAILSDGNTVAYHADDVTGMLHADGRICDHQLTVTYNAGYQTFPGDLMVVILSTFKTLWEQLKGVGATTTGQPLKRLSIDGMVTEFQTQNDITSSGTFADYGPISGSMIALLQPYRRLSS